MKVVDVQNEIGSVPFYCTRTRQAQLARLVAEEMVEDERSGTPSRRKLATQAHYLRCRLRDYSRDFHVSSEMRGLVYQASDCFPLGGDVSQLQLWISQVEALLPALKDEYDRLRAEEERAKAQAKAEERARKSKEFHEFLVDCWQAEMDRRYRPTKVERGIRAYPGQYLGIPGRNRPHWHKWGRP